MKCLARTDWLNMRPVYYCVDRKRCSPSASDLVDATTEFDPAGLWLYLRYGCSVFGRTPYKNIRLLPPNSALIQDEYGNIEVQEYPECDLDEFNLDVNGIVTSTEAHIRRVIGRNDCVLIPLSGGYDSRFVLGAIPRGVHPVTYTYSKGLNSNDDCDVVRAKHICAVTGADWNYIDIGDFLDHEEDWYVHMGPCVPLHGAYQYAAAANIPARGRDLLVLSGLVGDAWAGAKAFDEIDSPDELYRLGYGHKATYKDPSRVLHVGEREGRELEAAWYERKKGRLSDPRWRIIEFVRMRMPVLASLIKSHEFNGRNVYAPLCEQEIAISMLNLDSCVREDRKWQANFFKTAGLDSPASNFCSNKSVLFHPLRHSSRSLPLEAKSKHDIFRTEELTRLNSLIAPPTCERVMKRAFLRVRESSISRRISRFSDYRWEYRKYQLLKPLFWHSSLSLSE